MASQVYEFGTAEQSSSVKKVGEKSGPEKKENSTTFHVNGDAKFSAENLAAAAHEATEVSFEIYETDSHVADAAHPFLILDDAEGRLRHHVSGIFLNPRQDGVFEYVLNRQKGTARIQAADARFVSLIKWLADGRTAVRLSGSVTESGFAVYKMHAVDSAGVNRLSAEDSFLQLVTQRLLESAAPEADLSEDDEIPDREGTAEAENILLTDTQSIRNFLTCAGSTLPKNVRSWAGRNLNLTRSNAISPEERRHAQRALSMMLSIRWKSTYFESIDPAAARRILDEELFGMEKVKQRIIETIIQINRTHTLPAYGLLLAGPAGVGKSQAAYAVARILKLPWMSLDMSTIHDPEQLTGSPRVYSNAKPGRIMEAFSQAGTSNLVFIINELDKADAGNAGGNPADALLTLLDNLGYTDNYIECTIPTGGVYPIATANDKEKISKPLMTRFALIDIPDYTHDEKKIIFQRFSLPKVLKRMQISPEECVVTDRGADAVIERFADEPGCRDLEQAAEHIAANALYRIETEKMSSVRYDYGATKRLLEG